MTGSPARRWLSLLAAGLASLCCSCSADPGNEPSASEAANGGASNLAGAAAVGGGATVNPLGRARCQPPPGTTGSPHTIEDAVALLNALPKPTNTACFVESLERPFAAFATSSPFSAQPALSARSPRVFIKLERLWVSVVLDGDSSYLIEFSYLLDELHSVKGEVKTPLLEALAPSAPYDRVRHDNGTVCGLCHYGEEPVPSITFAQAFASIPFRPRPETRVSLEGLTSDARACDWTAEPHRCEMLSALFDDGVVTEESFPPTMPTFF